MNGTNISNNLHVVNSTPVNYNTDFLKDLKEDVEKHASSFKSLFEVQRAIQAIEEAMAMPDPVQLYPFLVLQNELAVLFADTGVGKTVFAFQMAIHIANTTGLTVLFLDLELSKKQFQRRYTSLDGKPFPLAANLYRLGFSRLKKLPTNSTYEDFFFQSLVDAVDQTGAKVIFLDNLTKLAAGDTDSAKAAIPILEKLNDLKADKDLTIIVLEHNKKVDTSRPIQLNDLQGSKMKSNLVDAVFSIGRSAKDKNLRYIKQVKVRDGEVVYDTENVLLCEISKANGYLSFTEMGQTTEYEHLTQKSEKDKTADEENMLTLHQGGKSYRDIASEFGISHMSVKRIIDKKTGL